MERARQSIVGGSSTGTSRDLHTYLKHSIIACDQIRLWAFVFFIISRETYGNSLWVNIIGSGTSASVGIEDKVTGQNAIIE